MMFCFSERTMQFANSFRWDEPKLNKFCFRSQVYLFLPKQLQTNQEQRRLAQSVTLSAFQGALLIFRKRWVFFAQKST